MKANYHTHTWRCNHAEDNERLYVERAIEGGIEILGFSDHTPYPFPADHFSNFRMRPIQFEDYIDTVLALKKEYASDIEIHLGLEAEYYPKYFEKFQRMIADYPIEYMILGQHFLDNEINATYSGATTLSKKNLTKYVDQVIEAMNMGCFTYLAHPDLIKFMGLPWIYQKEMRRLCKEAKKLDIPLEINFLGIWDQRNYPNEKFWEIVGQEGNKVIFGCDAHARGDVWQPETERFAYENLVEKYKLNLIETTDFRNPIL